MIPGSICAEFVQSSDFLLWLLQTLEQLNSVLQITEHKWRKNPCTEQKWTNSCTEQKSISVSYPVPIHSFRLFRWMLWRFIYGKREDQFPQDRYSPPVHQSRRIETSTLNPLQELLEDWNGCQHICLFIWVIKKKIFFYQISLTFSHLAHMIT